MDQFYEKLKMMSPARGPVTAWVVAGPSRGARALFETVEGKLHPVCCDDAFPEELLQSLFVPHKGYLMTSQGEHSVFLESGTATRRLVVCGAGHVSMPIIRIGRLLNYDITVIEDRETFAQRAKEAGAQHIIVSAFAEALETLDAGPDAAFIIVTREHSFDVDCLRQVLKKEYAYVGLMGSHGRTARIRDMLADEGFPEARLSQIHMPIGLPIGSRTPEEIAVSIFAEVIQVMNARIPQEGFSDAMLDELCRASGEDGCVSGILAIIVAKRDEAPRQPGTKMFVRRDGTFMGSIGGGYAESVVLKDAKNMLESDCRECRLITVSANKGIMQCGGEIDVLLMPVSL